MSPCRRLLFPVAAAMLVSACLSVDDPVVIPENALVFKIDPSLIRYDFVDSTISAQGGVALTWLPAMPYIGLNCLGLVPNAPPDTTGTFVFAVVGPNTGQLERRTVTGITDTIVGYFMPPNTVAQGTHGSYALDSSGRLRLTWADGTQTRYFDPVADIRVIGDTIRSVTDTRSNGDSVRVQWTVNWTRDIDC